MIRTILGFVIGIPLSLFVTFLQYFLYYLQKSMRWLSNKCTRAYKQVGSPWYIKRDKNNRVYKGPFILEFWRILMYNVDELKNEEDSN